MPWQNGLYRAVTTGFDAPYSLMLRIDLTPEAGKKSYVSMDLYNGFMLPTIDPDQSGAPDNLLYLGSFRSSPLDPTQPGPDDLTVALGFQTPGSSGIGSPNVQLRLLRDADPAHPTYSITYQVLDGGDAIPVGPLSFAAFSIGQSFHELVLTVDAAPGFPKPYSVPADPIAKRPTFADCFRRAGIDVIGPGANDDELPVQDSWTIRDLINQERAKPQARHKGWSLSAYLMIATALADSPDTTGIMFDRKRRGAAAVFYSSLRRYFGSEGRDSELATNFLFTAIHEVAHCLNLPHAFEEARLAGLSSSVATFTNYPQDYTGNGDAVDPQKFQGVPGWNSDQTAMYQNFWSVFGYAFHPQELLELRHGARGDLVTGDKVSPYRGQFGGPGTSMSIGGPSGNGLVLTLRFRGPNRPGVAPAAQRIRDGADGESPRAIFEFGEPIQVEAELRNYWKGSRMVSRRLSSATGDLQIHYQTPQKQFVTYHPAGALCYIPHPLKIAGANRRTGRDSFHKDVCLNLCGGSFQFLTPGLYRVRASYRFRDTQLISNILEVYVRYPTPAVENLVVPLLDEDVATYLAFRGVSGLTAARGRLRAAFLDDDDAPRPDVTHPLKNYFHACEAMLCAHEPFNTKGQKEKHRLFANALALGRLNELTNRTRSAQVNLAALPFSNIALAKVGRRICDALKSGPQEITLASALSRKLHDALEARGVPERVRNRCLPGDPRKTTS